MWASRCKIRIEKPWSIICPGLFRVVGVGIFGIVLGSSYAIAAVSGAQTITVDGRLTNLAGDAGLIDSSVVIDVKIYNPAANCIIYEEHQTVDTSQTDGRFTILVGSSTGSPKRTGSDVGNPMVSVFQNNLPIAGSCGSYTPVSGDTRLLRVTVAPSTTGAIEVLSPDTILDQVPNALVAETLQGLDRDHVLAIDSTTSLSQANVANIFSAGNYPILTSLLAGTNSQYVTSSASGGAKIPSVTTAPSAPSAGQIWFNSSANAFQYYNGSSVQTVGTSGAGISSITVGSSLTAGGTAGGTLTGPGTIDIVNSGVTAGTYAKVTVNSKGFVTYGSGLTESDLPVIQTPGKVVGDAITSGTIGGSTAFYSSGNVTTTGNISGTNISSNVDSTRALRIFDPANSSVNYITFTAPTLTSNYSVVFPNLQGAAGTTLMNDGSGHLSWVSGSAGSVTSVGLSLPSIFSVTTPIVTSSGTLAASLINQNANLIFAGPESGGSAAPAFRGLAVADLPPGYDASVMKTSLASGSIWVGNSAGIAAAVTPYGDFVMSIAGSGTVTGLQGFPISATSPTTAGQMLRWSGSAWTPNFVAMTDLRSTITGANAFQTSCAANQTLTYNSVGDMMSCSNISISSAQVTWASTGANLVFAGPSTGGAAAPGFRTLTSADLPSGVYDQTYFKQNGNVFAAPAVLGTTDTQPVSFITANTSRLTITSSGNIGVGVASPTARFVLPAGSSIAGSSPLKITSGPVMTAPEPGAVEFDGTSLYYTDSGSVRHALQASGTGIATLTGDVSASGNGSVSSVVNRVNGVIYPATPSINTVPVITSAGTVTYEQIPNAALANNTMTVGSTVLTLGGTANTVAGLTSLGLGVNGTTTGLLNLSNGATGGASTTIQASPSTMTAWSLTLPANPGSAGTFLQTNGSGLTTWASPAGSGTVASGLINQLAFYSSAGTLVSGLASANNSVLLTNGSGIPSWNLSSNDNFSQYAILSGRAGGQVWNGGTGASENATISSTSNATKGFVLLQPSGGNVGIGTATPLALLDISGTGAQSAMLVPRDSTAARPTGVNGMLRYNTSLNLLESYSNGSWIGVAASGAGISALIGDVTASGNGSVSSTVAKVNGVSYPALPIVNTVPVVTAAGVVTYEQIPNAALANNTTTVGSTVLTLGGTANSLAALTSLGLGVNGTTTGLLNLSNGATGGATTSIQASPSTMTAWSLTLPSSSGTSGSYLQTNGSGVTSWVTPAGTGTVQSGAANQLAFYSSAGTLVSGLASANNSVLLTNGSGVPSWNLSASDNFSQYALLGGRAGGQVWNGGSGAAENATISSTSNATKGFVLLQPSGGYVGIGTATPSALLDVYGTGAQSAMLVPRDTTGMRPTGINGMLRYNTSLNLLESYSNGAWIGVAASGTGISALIGDVTASGNGSVSSTVAKVNGVSYPALPSVNTVPVVTAAGVVIYEQIPNAALANNTTTLGSTILTLGGTANTIAGLTSLGLGVNGTTTGLLNLSNGATGGATTTLQANPSTTTAWSLTLPANPGSAGTFLQTNGSGLTTWASPAGSGTVASGLINQLAFYGSAGTLVSGLASANNSVLLTNGSGVPSWNLSASDNFLQYALLGGRAGGQVWNGGSGASENATISSTSNATKGFVLLQPSGGNVGVGTTSPQALLDVYGTGTSSAMLVPRDTTTNRPAAGINGMIRYNTTLNLLESYSNGAWAGVAASGSGISAIIGDVTASGNGSVSSTVAKVNGVSYPASPTTNTVPVVTASGVVTYEAIPNAALANNSTTLGSTVLTLGGTANSVSGLTSLGLGVNGSTTGILNLSNSSSGGATTTLQASPSTMTAWSLTLPPSSGTVGSYLQTNGSGVTSWVTPAGTGTVQSGLSNQLAFYGSAGSIVGGLTSSNSSVLLTNGSGVPSWNLSANDNFSQYALLSGRAGGQVWNGGSGASDNATISSTSNATKGFVLLQPSGGNVGVGTTSPQAILDVNGSGTSQSAMLVPRDSTSMRPTGINGMLRYNTSNAQLRPTRQARGRDSRRLILAVEVSCLFRAEH